MARIAALLALVGLLAFARAAEARVIRVRARDGIAEAIRGARPGDVVSIAPGTYAGGVWVETSGAPGNPITVRGEGNLGDVVIEGGGEGLSVGDGAHDLVFERLEVRGSDDNLVHVQGGAARVVLREMRVHDAGHDGDAVKVNQAREITIERVECFHPGDRPDRPDGNPAQECIDLLDVQGAVVRDCFLHDGGNMLLYAKGGSRDVLFERNVIAGQGTDAIDPCVGLGAASDPELLRGARYEAERVVFRNNVVVRCRAGAVGVYDARDVWILHNTLLDDGPRMIEFRAGNGPAAESRDVRVANNVLANASGAMEAAYALRSHGLRGFEAQHNLYWNGARPVPRGGVSDLDREPGAVFADPGVRAPSGTDDRAAIVRMATPSAQSALVDRAANVPGAAASDDLIGHGRARGTAPDLGAIESDGRGPIALPSRAEPVAPPAGARGGGPVRGCASGCTVGRSNGRAVPCALLSLLAAARLARRRTSAGPGSVRWRGATRSRGT